MDDLMRSAQAVVERLRRRDDEFSRLIRITERINYGLMLEEILEFVYREMREVIPYERIGFSLIDETRGVVVARWAHSDRPMLLKGGYEAPLAGSTLQEILDTGRVRILNDLEEYLRLRPSSRSTELIVREGMRSSLTCPLVVQGKRVGFMFFSSVRPGAYTDVHVDFFQQIAGQLSAIVEKGRLYSELARQKAVIEDQNRRFREELEMARQVQLALIPQSAPEVPGLRLAFEYTPAVQVGGDVLDIIPLADGRLFVFVGDAMGHGVPAALVMGVVKTALATAVQADPDPGRVLGAVNQTLAGLFTTSFVTAACALLDPASHRAGSASAGHALPFWFRGDSGDVVQEGDAGIPLGVDDASAYATQKFGMQPGDSLVLSSDGVFEAEDAAGARYGLDRLRRRIASAGRLEARELLAAIRKDLDAHRAGASLKDDLTLLVVKAVEQ